MPEPRSITPLKPSASARSGETTPMPTALLPDAVLGEQRLVFVDVLGKALGEVLDEVEQRALAAAVQGLEVAAAPELRRVVLRHRVRQVAVHAARAVVGRVHARAGHRLVAVEQVLALAKAVEEDRHRAEVEPCVPRNSRWFRMRVISSNMTRMYFSRAPGSHAEQLLDRQHVGVLVAHHRDVVEPVHVRQVLQVGAVLGELLGRAVQQADVRVGALDHLAVELEHQAQHAVRRRVLRAEVQRVVADLRHRASRPRRSGPRARCAA